MLPGQQAPLHGTQHNINRIHDAGDRPIIASIFNFHDRDAWNWELLINTRILNTDMSANATTEKTLNSPREQGENKSGKIRPTRQNIMKKKHNTSIFPVSLVLEAI